MVELRWVRRSVPAPEYGPDINTTIRVLQYRTVEGQWMPKWRGDVPGIEFVPDAVNEPTWTDWRDVPEVTEAV